jgi:ABC-2 type transport system permease protein
MTPASALWLRCRREWANARRIARSQPLLKRVVISVSAIVFEALLCALFYDGFHFLNALSGVGGLILGRLFSLFFLALSLMLVLSSLVTAYSAFFRSPEIPFLLTRPFTLSQIVTYKYIESTILASWAYFAVVIPFMAAYAFFERITLVFILWTLVFSIPFLFLCSGLGALAVLIGARWLAGRRFLWPSLGLLAAFLVLALAMAPGIRSPEIHANQFTISQLVPGLRLAGNALLPSWWLSEGIQSLASGNILRGLMLWAVLATSAWMIALLIEWIGANVYFDAWVKASANLGAEKRKAVLLPRLPPLLQFLPDDIRALIIKDLRTFLRDPVQWTQAGIFFGLLGLFFANMNPNHYRFLPPEWQSLVAFVNVFSVAAVMCSMGSRFLYPQLSLEGHSFWIIGLAPTSLRRLVFAKFAVAATSLATIGVILILIAAHRMGMPPEVLGSAAFVAAAIGIAISGLSVGLGALFLDLRQTNPAAIVSGFGGTLNLVLSLAMMIAAILPFAMCFHLKATGALYGQHFRTGLIVSAACVTGLTLLATILPLHLGIRSLNRRDF